ncbi:aminopeptidase P N-terminal domain-containing protein [Hymenobacter sp. BT770]|uniref:aminopeptidase P N-terminal domain-containing protein n=1 Tax=Hymenobacter sp. BT770 TaxID=2886942 RepID=UPI001D10D14F|nr:aminopeptidase P N-terminal domain-containing protein [Hymenobacter sp. BT770]MCC3153787.1 aminopeptidase P N-terminal domain-containing protein [Hymenobacter sp. BT770]MDO3416921.1 aminopeptidase P N-terminal domain-containing protein [Hymenobacter sp. BT770]
MLLASHWRRSAKMVLSGWLALAAFAAAAQKPTSIPEPLSAAPSPARPTDFLSPAFHKQRRELVRAQLPPHGVAVVFAAPVRNRANDVDYVYHQNPDFHYLTGYEEPDAVLLLFKEPRTVGGQPGITEALFTQPRDPAREQWTGRRLGAAGAEGQLGVQFAADNKEFAKAGIAWADFDQILFTDLPTDARDDAKAPADLASLVATFRQQTALPADYDPTRTVVAKLLKRYGASNPKEMKAYLTTLVQERPAMANEPSVKAYLAATTDAERQRAINPNATSRYDGVTLGEQLDELRAVKTDDELALLRRAIRISAQGQREVMKLLRPDMGEMDVQGLHEYVYRRYGAEFQGYPSIVGGGANGCILHYETNDRQRLDNDLVLMDCGAEYHGYSADVTRTAPPSGKFSPTQRQIYELVLAAQEAGFAACRPGAEFNAPNKATQDVVANGLLKLGIIKKKEEFRRYYPHGASHYLGLDVHDRGTYGPLRAGNVITVEPGIYIPAGSPCDPKWWNIGVRIEDDALITATGYENLSAEAPRTVADIEKLMAEPSALEGWKLPELK